MGDMLSADEQIAKRGKPVMRPDQPVERAVRVLVFDDDPERKPRLYVCTGCGSGHSPAIYACRDEEAHRAARSAAENCYTCKTHNQCQDCGAQCDKHWLVCPGCRLKRMLAKREHVAADSFDYCFSLEGDGFYGSALEAAEAGEQWVCPAEPLRTFSLDAESILDSLLEDHFEDASWHDLDGTQDLLEAIDRFNKAQKQGSYDRDEKRVCFVGDLAPANDDAEEACSSGPCDAKRTEERE